MPYIYAIAEKVYEDVVSPSGHVYQRFNYEYKPATEELAEVHEEGRYKLLNHEGFEVTQWLAFYPQYRAEDTTKVGKGKPLKDAIGQELAAGDFVMVTTSSHANLGIMEVASFTPKKVRVRTVRGIGDGTPKNASDVVKIDKGLFF